MKKKPAPKYQPGEGHLTPCHFFASSVAEWKTSDNIDDVLAFMKRAGFPFNLWLVPLPRDAEYNISNFYPQVQGCTFIGMWGFEETTE